MVAEPMNYAFKSIRMKPVSKNFEIILQGFEKTAVAATVSSPKPKGTPSLIRDEGVNQCRF